MIAIRLLMLVLTTAGFAVVWSGDQTEQRRILAMRGAAGADRIARKAAPWSARIAADESTRFAPLCEAAARQPHGLRIEHAGREWRLIPVDSFAPRRTASRP